MAFPARRACPRKSRRRSALAIPHVRMKIGASYRFSLAVSLVEKWNPRAWRAAARPARGGIDESQACGEAELLTEGAGRPTVAVIQPRKGCDMASVDP